MEAFYFAYRMGREAFDGAQRVNVQSLENCVTRVSDIKRIDLAAAHILAPEVTQPGCLCNVGPNTNKHHILTAGNVNRHISPYVVRHRWNGPIPPDSFRLLGSGIYVSVPEFTFLQLASTLSLVQLAIVGCSLCSSYFINDSKHICRRSPISSISRLRGYLESADGSYGINNAKKAVDYIASGAESPTEIDMYALTCFSRKMGGQEMPKAVLNHVVPVLPTDNTIVDRPERSAWRIDMCWPELKKGIEYLGKQHDTTPAEDRERINSLICAGYSILQFDYRHLINQHGKNRREQQIARLLIGDTYTEPILSRAEIAAKEALENQLFGPAHFRL